MLFLPECFSFIGTNQSEVCHIHAVAIACLGEVCFSSSRTQRMLLLLLLLLLQLLRSADSANGCAATACSRCCIVHLASHAKKRAVYPKPPQHGRFTPHSLAGSCCCSPRMQGRICASIAMPTGMMWGAYPPIVRIVENCTTSFSSVHCGPKYASLQMRRSQMRRSTSDAWPCSRLTGDCADSCSHAAPGWPAHAAVLPAGSSAQLVAVSGRLPGDRA